MTRCFIAAFVLALQLVGIGAFLTQWRSAAKRIFEGVQLPVSPDDDVVPQQLDREKILKEPGTYAKENIRSTIDDLDDSIQELLVKIADDFKFKAPTRTLSSERSKAPQSPKPKPVNTPTEMNPDVQALSSIEIGPAIMAALDKAAKNAEKVDLSGLKSIFSNAASSLASLNDNFDRGAAETTPGLEKVAREAQNYFVVDPYEKTQASVLKAVAAVRTQKKKQGSGRLAEMLWKLDDKVRNGLEKLPENKLDAQITAMEDQLNAMMEQKQQKEVSPPSAAPPITLDPVIAQQLKKKQSTPEQEVSSVAAQADVSVTAPPLAVAATPAATTAKSEAEAGQKKVSFDQTPLWQKALSRRIGEYAAAEEQKASKKTQVAQAAISPAVAPAKAPATPVEAAVIPANAPAAAPAKAAGTPAKPAAAAKAAGTPAKAAAAAKAAVVPAKAAAAAAARAAVTPAKAAATAKVAAEGAAPPTLALEEEAVAAAAAARERERVRLVLVEKALLNFAAARPRLRQGARLARAELAEFLGLVKLLADGFAAEEVVTATRDGAHLAGAWDLRFTQDGGKGHPLGRLVSQRARFWPSAKVIELEQRVAVLPGVPALPFWAEARYFWSTELSFAAHVGAGPELGVDMNLEVVYLSQRVCVLKDMLTGKYKVLTPAQEGGGGGA